MINFRRHDNTKRKPAKKKRQASRKQLDQGLNIQFDRRIIISVLAVMTLALIIGLLPKQEWMPIEKIRISGNFKYLDTAKIEQQLEGQLGQGFFAVDIQGIQQQISQQPWIKNVSVRRVWPSLIAVHVQEKQAVARWSDTQLLDTDAVIFQADSQQFKHLPLIHGYSANSRNLLSKYAELNQLFGQYQIQLSALNMDSKGALTLLLNDQLKVSLGSEENERKIRHMLSVYPQQIKTRSEHIEHIDFRYSNGFAIAWKKEYLEKIGQLQRGSKNV